MSNISREDYDQLAAFVASVKDRVSTKQGDKIYGLYFHRAALEADTIKKPLFGFDINGYTGKWHINGIICEHNIAENQADLMVVTTVIKREPLPEVTPEIINDLFNEGELYVYDQKINRLIVTPDHESFAGSFCKKDGTYGVFCGAFNQKDHFGFYSKTETTTRVPFAEAFKQFQANALNG